ncbi:hypothetical protein N8987_00715 [Crocinitomix sp.]|nr:hypothetical protein [Crocinitomix sp.]
MKRFLINRAKVKKRLTRKPILRKLNVYREILIISDQDKSMLKTTITAIFPNAKIYFLSQRKEKEESAKNANFTFHASDLNLTGKVKNDKLNSLLDNRFDLVVDLSGNLPLNNFIIGKLNHTFMVGTEESGKGLWYDLIIKNTKSDQEFFENIKAQINLLSQNGTK